jgi:rhodanese-related sulfurtransferase
MSMARSLIFLIVIGAVAAGTGYYFFSSPSKPMLRLVNVLDAPEFEDCRIPSSVNISVMDLPKACEKWSKDDTIVFYCSNYMCSASGTACKIVKRLGFEKVYAYEAGMAGWYQAGLRYEGSGKSPYLTMENREPENKHSDILIVDTFELKTMLDKAGITVNK